ncbi:MAG: PHP domain-containing protein [Methanocella sp.]
MLKYDLHLHSRYSPDGTLDVRDIFRIAKKRGLDGIAITDHDTVRGGLEALKLKPEGLDVICGCEVNTDRGDVIGLFLTEEIRSKEHVSVIEEIHAQGGVAVVPHPFDSIRGSAFWLTDRDAPLIDGVEVVNARCVFRRSNAAADLYAGRFDRARTGGSDAHFGGEIGNACTLIEDGDNIREAILGRRTRPFGQLSSPVFHLRTKALLMERRVIKRRY